MRRRPPYYIIIYTFAVHFLDWLIGSRPEDYENVVVFGHVTFQRGVIAAQSQQTLKFWIRPQKNDIRDVGSTADLDKYQTFSGFF